MKKITKALFILLLVLTAACLASCSLLGGNKTDGKKSVKKVALTESMVIDSPMKGTGIPVYTGSPITFPESSFSFEVNGKYPSYSDFTYTYETNVDAGENTAAVIIAAKPENAYCTGSVKLRFSIAKGTITTGNRAELTALLENKNYSSVSFEGNGFIENLDTLAIPEGATLKLVGGALLTVKGQLVNNGTLIVDGSTYYNGGTRAGCLKNVGIVRNNGSVKVTSIGEIINEGQFFSEGTISNEGAVYTNDTALPGLTNVKTGAQYVRTEITEEDISFPSLSENGVEYSQTNSVVRPSVALSQRNADYTVEYEGNDHAGTATVTVTPAEKDRYYYGSASKRFTIARGVATVNNYAQFSEASGSFNFDRYEITGDIVVPAEETVYINSYEVLNFAGNKLTVNGTFINNGTIKSYKTSHNARTGETTLNEFTLDIIVGEGGAFRGEGTLFAEKINVTAKGDFTLQSPETTTFITFSQQKGTFNAKSPFTATTLSVGTNAGFILETRVAANLTNLNVSGEFSVKGTLDVSGESYFYGDVVRYNNGLIYFGTDTHFYYLNLSNSGAIYNRGDFVCDNHTAYYTSGGSFDNTNGHLWTYEEFGNITENVTIKKKLTNANVALEYTEIEYDGTVKKPLFTIEGVTPTNLTEYYNVSYSDANPRTVETYTVTISAKKAKCDYGGSVQLTFNIKKGTFHATTASNFGSSIKNTNFEKVLLDADINIGNTYELSRYEIYSGITVDTNGYSLTVTHANFDVTGGLVLSAPTGERKYSLLLLQTSNLRNHNVVTNNGVLCFDSEHENYFTDGNSDVTFVNNGSVYGGGSSLFTSASVTSGSGNVYERTVMPEADLSLEYTETPYTGSNLTPIVSYTGSVLAPGTFDNFGKTYSNNRNAGAATVTVKPDLLNKTYYGSVTLDFTINRAVKVVTTSLNSSDFTDKNYYEVRLGSNNIILSEDVVVPSDMSFNFSVYYLNYSTGRLLIEDGAVLRAEAIDRSTFMKNVNNVHEIKLLDNVADKISVTFRPIDTTTDKIHLAKYNSRNELYTETFKINNLRIDLNGYSMTGGFEITTNKKTYTNPYFTLDIINNTQQESVIGNTSSTEYGFVQKYNSEMQERIVVNLNNVTVAGIRIDGHNVGRGIQLNATDCKIQTAGTYALDNPWNDINADSVFNNCSFSAADNNGKIIYIYSGTHYFNNCTYNASPLVGSMINYRTSTSGGSHIPSVYINDIKQN